MSTFSRKSIASSELPGYFVFKLARSPGGNWSRYSRAFRSVTKLLSDSVGVPMTANIIASWSFEENGKPFLYSVGFFAGESGKHDFPGNRGCLSMKVGAFSRIIPSNSAKIQPTAHTSIPGP